MIRAVVLIWQYDFGCRILVFCYEPEHLKSLTIAVTFGWRLDAPQSSTSFQLAC